MLHKLILLAICRCVRPVLVPLFLRAAILIIGLGYSSTVATACEQQVGVRQFAQKISTAAMAHSTALMTFVLNRCLAAIGTQSTINESSLAVGDRPFHRACKMSWRKVYRRSQLRYSLSNRLDYLKMVAALLLFMVPWLAWV